LHTAEKLFEETAESVELTGTDHPMILRAIEQPPVVAENGGGQHVNHDERRTSCTRT